MKFLAILTIHFLFSIALNGQNLVTYEGPEGIQASDRFDVFVRAAGDEKWQPLFVYTAKVNVRGARKSGQCSFANFDASYAKPVEVKVLVKSGSFQNVAVRPDGKTNALTKGAKSIQFKVSGPQKLSVEFDNDRLNNLLLFANEIETNVPDKNDPNVVYLGPGVYQAEKVKVKSGQTIYLHGSALVQGSINIYDKNNITIRGRGVMNGESLNHDRSKTRPNLLKFKNGNNIRVEGITLVDSPVWSLFMDNCENVTINNVKVISYMINADGITLSQSRNVKVTNAFVRTSDDNISIKSMNGGECSDITVQNSTLWADDAHNMLIGPESKGATYKNIRFSDIDVLENTQKAGTYSGVMSIMASDKANVSGIYWDGITIGDISGGEIIRLNYTKVHSVEKDNYGNDIKDIHFANITYTGQNATPGTIKGIDGNRTIKDVTIKNFRFNKELVQGTESASPTAASSRSLRSASRQAPQISVNNFVEKMKITE